MAPHTDVTINEDTAKTAPSPNPDHVKIWIAMNLARLSIMRKVDKTLRTNGLPPLTWYDVLWAIERNGGEVRPQEILEGLLFEPSALSHMSKRMASAGLIDICVAKEDRRGRVLRITPKGRTARAEIWMIYGAALEQELRPLGHLANPGAVAQALAEISGTKLD